MSAMAEVLARHKYDKERAVCSCSDFVQVGLRCDAQTHPEHLAEVLTAAGFGPVKDPADAWAEGHESGFWNGRLSQLTVPYDAPDPLIGKQHAYATNPYRPATERDSTT